MSYSFLNKINLDDLREIASTKLNIDAKSISKSDLKSIIINGFKKYKLPSSPTPIITNKKEKLVEHKSETKKNDKKKSIKIEIKTKDKTNKYLIDKKIGHQGKEGTIYKVKKEGGKKEYALKQFSKSKSSNNLEKEANFLKIAGNAEISPKMIEYNLDKKYIVMDLLDKSLFDILKENKGKISIEYQKRIIEICKLLDKLGIFHGDPSPLNFMEKDGKLYIIDFGFSKEINDDILQKVGKHPNLKVIPLGFMVKIKEVCNPKNFPELMKYISKEDKVQFGLV
jgi:tRNA A-37 threonylcarbamoyl transferase component Bud32